MSEARPIAIPLILGTTRQVQMSAHVARFVRRESKKRRGVAAELGINDLKFSEVAFRSERVASSVDSV